MRGFTYFQNQDFENDLDDDLYDKSDEEVEELFFEEFGGESFSLEDSIAAQESSLPISSRNARKVARWLRTHFGEKMRAATAGTPFSPVLLSAMVCQETAYFWLSLVNKVSPEEILGRCVLDASGDVRGHPRSVFPRNTAEFRRRFGATFTNMLITEANKTRELRGFGPRQWVYKGYGILQYDLQFVDDDEAFFRDKQWYDFDICLRRALGELKEKYRICNNDLWCAVRRYNGGGAPARRYVKNVRRFFELCEPVWNEEGAVGSSVRGFLPAFETIRENLVRTQRTTSKEFIVEFESSPPPDLADRISNVIPGDSRVEQLFEKDQRFQRIRIYGLGASSFENLNPFDVLEPLRAALGARSVEPDLATDFFPIQPDRALGEEGLESLDTLGCWVNQDEPAPEDPAWALRNIHVSEAWAFSRQQRRPSQGKGILVAQPDTGVTDHPELKGCFDKTRWVDLLDGGPPWDPLIDIDPTDTPGHGTATASVAASRGSVERSHTGPPGRVTGSAPEAKLVPIRCIESVMRISQSRVAQAIDHANESGCHVITMSLGGLWSRALSVAIRRAIENNIVVMAAAGNCVRTVVWPARFDRCIAVAGSNVHDMTWKGSCRGPSVDISAPAQHVYRASRKPSSSDRFETGPGEGTSFAVALTAGVAAMWLAHHGRRMLIDGLAPDEKLQDRFIALLQQTARRPDNWDASNFGSGIVDAYELLKAGISAGEEAVSWRRGGTPIDADVAEVAREFISEFVSQPESAAVESELLETHGLELMWLAMSRAKEANVSAESLDISSVPTASVALREALRRTKNSPLSRRLGISTQEPEHVVDLTYDLHNDPEEPQDEAPIPEAARVPPWRLAKSLEKLREQVNARAPRRNKSHDGAIGDARHRSRKSDHNPWVTDGRLGVVTAVDITHDPKNRCDANIIAAALQENKDPRVKYVIWNRKIMSATKSPWQWRRYSGRNGHTKHIHVSVNSEKSHYDSIKDWNI